MSIRTDILDEIKATLETITIANGYNNDIRLVEDETFKAPDELNADEFPALFIIDIDEDKKVADVDSLENELELLITGYVKSHNSTQLERRKLQEDVEIAMCADRQRNNLAIETLPSKILTDKGTMQPYGIFDLTFKITYFQVYGTP